jgi:hypothetical protein
MTKRSIYASPIQLDVFRELPVSFVRKQPLGRSVIEQTIRPGWSSMTFLFPTVLYTYVYVYLVESASAS